MQRKSHNLNFDELIAVQRILRSYQNHETIKSFYYFAIPVLLRQKFDSAKFESMTFDELLEVGLRLYKTEEM